VTVGFLDADSFAALITTDGGDSTDSDFSFIAVGQR
jgi:hypothetical protein